MNILKFKPLLKTTIWGGEKIVPFKHLDSNEKQVGESWEVSGVKDNESIVAEGDYAGWKLNDLVASLKDKLVGKRTTNALVMSFLCLLSLSMHVSNSLFRYIQLMNRHRLWVRVGVKRRCGTL